MSLKIMIDDLRPVANDVWEATISQKDLGIINSIALRDGDISVLLARNPTITEDGRLEFSPQQARIINLGDSERVIIIAAWDRPGQQHAAQDGAAERPASDSAVSPAASQPAGQHPAPGGSGGGDAHREGFGPGSGEPLDPYEPREYDPRSF